MDGSAISGRCAVQCRKSSRKRRGERGPPGEIPPSLSVQEREREHGSPEREREEAAGQVTEHTHTHTQKNPMAYAARVLLLKHVCVRVACVRARAQRQSKARRGARASKKRQPPKKFVGGGGERVVGSRPHEDRYRPLMVDACFGILPHEYTQKQRRAHATAVDAGLRGEACVTRHTQLPINQNLKEEKVCKKERRGQSQTWMGWACKMNNNGR